MEEYRAGGKQGNKENLKNTAVRLFVATAIATAGGAKEAEAQKFEQSGLEKYGKILLYNADKEHGGTVGRGGIVRDTKNNQALLCTIAYVANGGKVMDGVFTEQRSGGDDPILCHVIGEDMGNFEDAPEVSTESVDEGYIISMADDKGGTVDFVVTYTEPHKVWFKPENPDDWKPSGGDSGSIVAHIEGKDIDALGVYGGQSIQPNREKPSEPIVTYFMVPFEESSSED